MTEAIQQVRLNWPKQLLNKISYISFRDKAIFTKFIRTHLKTGEKRFLHTGVAGNVCWPGVSKLDYVRVIFVALGIKVSRAYHYLRQEKLRSAVFVCLFVGSFVCYRATLCVALS